VQAEKSPVLTIKSAQRDKNSTATQTRRKTAIIIIIIWYFNRRSNMELGQESKALTTCSWGTKFENGRLEDGEG
jgi:hypothetical protein